MGTMDVIDNRSEGDAPRPARRTAHTCRSRHAFYKTQTWSRGAPGTAFSASLRINPLTSEPHGRCSPATTQG
jgi:hypothetical protein